MYYEGVRFNVISVIMRGCVGVKYPGKMHYVTLEWPLVLVLVLVGLEAIVSA